MSPRVRCQRRGQKQHFDSSTEEINGRWRISTVCRRKQWSQVSAESSAFNQRAGIGSPASITAKTMHSLTEMKQTAEATGVASVTSLHDRIIVVRGISLESMVHRWWEPRKPEDRQ